MSEPIKCLSAQGFRQLPRPLAAALAAAAVAAASLLAAPPIAAAAERPATPPWGALPPADSYDPAVPTPAEVLGFEIGTRHVRHDQLVDYLEQLAAASDRVEVEVQGRTYEDRPQLLLTISSPANLARRDEIRRAHLAVSEAPWDEPAAERIDEMPVVVWLGYSIHGDEASGANASLLVAYHLAAAEGPEVERLLDRAVVLLDPSLNPDGLDRFAHWVAIHRGRVEVDDPMHREHIQGWPSARTNHYWFDLNRDWLLLQHPASRARVATFQRWRPNVAADFHEMGTDATFFFQPGVPSRQNPLTPDRNLELTREIARFHADAFDRAGELYYSEESYDDFYYGKGSTYPDVQGAVGILFEQASSRGIRQQSDQGLLTFADTVANQVRASFSTLAAAEAKRGDLLAWQRDFYRQSTAAAASGPVGGWIVGTGGDPARAAELVSILAGHRIEVHRLGREVTVDGRTFAAGEAFVVPAAQRQARLVEALFERRTSFRDSVFYDVSAWTLPLAFGLPWAEVPRARWSADLVGEPAVAAAAVPPGRSPAAGVGYAWAFDWRGRWAPRALQRLLDAGVTARVATRPFRAETDAGPRDFDYGTVIVPAAQPVPPEVVGDLVAQIAREDGVDVWALASGLTGGGIDLGSPSMLPVSSPRPLLVVGHHVSQYEAGEVWHLLDQRYGLPLSLVERDRLGAADLDDYTHVILVAGRYDDLPEETVASLRHFLRGGGVVVATQEAAPWAGAALVGDGEGERGAGAAAGPAPEEAAGTTAQEEGPEEESSEDAAAEPRVAYADYESRHAIDVVGGAIFGVELDVTHPLAYGYSEAELAVFRDHSRVLEPSDNPYENVALYTEAPLLAGYASAENVERVAGSAALVASRVGRGTLVRFADDPAFRAYWVGTQKLLMNALYFAPLVRATPLPEDR